MNGTSGTRTVRFNKVLLTTETAPVDPEEEDEARGIGIEEFRSFLRSGLYKLFVRVYFYPDGGQNGTGQIPKDLEPSEDIIGL